MVNSKRIFSWVKMKPEREKELFGGSLLVMLHLWQKMVN